MRMLKTFLKGCVVMLSYIAGAAAILGLVWLMRTFPIPTGVFLGVGAVYFLGHLYEVLEE